MSLNESIAENEEGRLALKAILLVSSNVAILEKLREVQGKAFESGTDLLRIAVGRYAFIHTVSGVMVRANARVEDGDTGCSIYALAIHSCKPQG